MKSATVRTLILFYLVTAVQTVFVADRNESNLQLINHITHVDISEIEADLNIVNAISDILRHRIGESDVLVLEENLVYRRTDLYSSSNIARALVKRLTDGNFKFSYLQMTKNFKHLSSIVKQVTQNARKVAVIFLGGSEALDDFLAKMLGDLQMDPAILYMVIDDKNLMKSKQVESIQNISYNVHIQVLLLKTANNLQKLKEMLPCLNISPITSFQNCETESQKEESKPRVYDLFIRVPIESKSVAFRLLGKWEANTGFYYVTAERELLFNNLKILKVAIPVSLFYEMNSENKSEMNSPMKNMLDHLAIQLKFKYEVLHPDDNEWGVSVFDEKRWTGAVNMLLERTADILPFLAITKERSEILDFSNPVMRTASGILMKAPTIPTQEFHFLLPFSLNVWISVLCMIPITSTILYLVNIGNSYYMNRNKGYRRKGLFKFHDCLWCVFGALLNQGSRFLPEAVSARILMSTWWIFTLITISTYSGNFIAFLAFPELDWRINSLEQLVNDKSIVIYVREGYSTEEEIEESTLDSMKILKIRLHEQKNAFLVKDLSKIMPMLLNGTAALLEDQHIISEIISRYAHGSNGTCELAMVPLTFSESYLSIATRKGSPYLKDINLIIGQLFLSGVMQEWIELYSETHKKCNIPTTTLRREQKDVNLKDIRGAFMILIIGLVSALFIVTVELLWSRITKTKQNSLSNIDMSNYLIKRSKENHKNVNVPIELQEEMKKKIIPIFRKIR